MGRRVCKRKAVKGGNQYNRKGRNEGKEGRRDGGWVRIKQETGKKEERTMGEKE